MLKFVLLFTVWTLAVVTDGSTIMDPKRLVKREVTIQLCGRNLMATLDLLCNGRSIFLSDDNRVRKRTADPYPVKDPVAYSTTERDGGGSGTASEHLLLSLISSSSESRGVVDECCRNRCSATTLISYCY
ncbi:insulin-like [Argiope bruennichi]|uniref:insulin-like n=1 Tax=Argiope bruennichi TaxID=94029 RepID=UPI002493F9CF|nr:insulin-like [Argiope bruennichi]